MTPKLPSTFVLLVFFLTAGVLSAQSDFEISSPNALGSGSFGFRTRIIDDVDGDNIPDIVVGAPDEDFDINSDTIPETNVGRVYVFSGDDQTLIWTFEGDQDGARFGFSVDGGDFNNDGVADIAIGAIEYDNGAAGAAGKAWIYDGDDGSELYSVTGTVTNEFVGFSVAFLGNIPRDATNGPDVWGDFAIGVPANLSNRRVLVVGQKAEPGSTTSIEVSTINQPIGGNKGRGFGSSVAALDFNDDGTPDVAVGAPDANGEITNFSSRGRVYIFSGTNLSTQLLKREGTNNNNQDYGRSVANAGAFDDVAGDDIVVGGPGYNDGISNAGMIEVVRYDATVLSGTSLLIIDGFESNQQLGNAVAGVGDVDNDTFDDILVGPGGPTSSFLGGNAWILSGSNVSGISEALDTTAREIFTLTDEITVGSSDGAGATGLDGGGDLNNDGEPDWVIGAAIRGTGGAVIGFSGSTIFAPPDPQNVLITSPSDGTVVSGSAVLITATADNADEIEFFVDAISVGIDTAAPFSATFDSTAFVDGTFDITVTARNSGGGSTDAGPVSITIDNTSPVAEFTAPSDADVVGGTIDVTATATDLFGISEVRLILGSTTIVDFDDPYATLFDTTLELDGLTTFTLEADDFNGNTATSSIDVTIDNTDPTVSITSHAEDDWVSGIITIEATAVDANLDRIEFFVEGNLIATDDDGSDGYSADFDTTGVLDGTLALEARAVDKAENDETTTVTVQVDNVAPENNIKRPADGRRVRHCFLITICADDSGSGIAGITLFVDGNEIDSTTTNQLCVIFDSHTVIDGPLDITAEIEDNAGNIVTETVTVIVNNLRERFRPSKIKLSHPGTRPFLVILRGPTVDLLSPVVDHDFFITFEGGPMIAATGEESLNGNRLEVEFDRLEVVSAINAAFTNPPRRLKVQIIADGQVIGQRRLRIKK